MMESGDNMASSFWSGEFYFNNIHSSIYKVCIVDVNESNVLKQVGSTFSISMEEDFSLRGNAVHRETSKTLENIVLQLCKTNNKPWTIGDISEIIGWLFHNDFKKFQPTDLNNQGYNLIYYLKAIDFKKVLNANMEGYLEITFKSYDGYVYAIPTYSLTVSGGETKSINSLSNINNIYYPKMKVMNSGDKTNIITIRNVTTSNELVISEMNPGETVIIDCAIGSVVNTNGKNRFSILKTFDFIGLNRGVNTISLSNNCVIEFICEFPMII